MMMRAIALRAEDHPSHRFSSSRPGMFRTTIPARSMPRSGGSLTRAKTRPRRVPRTTRTRMRKRVPLGGVAMSPRTRCAERPTQTGARMEVRVNAGKEWSGQRKASRNLSAALASGGKVEE